MNNEGFLSFYIGTIAMKKGGATRGASACAARATSTVHHLPFVIRHSSFDIPSADLILG
jgi:hypothetical protein